MKFEPSEFWDKKILQWEVDKYSLRKPLLIDFDVNSSLKARMELARSILKKVAPGRTILELGCGSGLLAENCISFGAKKYVGVDISSIAIQSAKQKMQNSQASSQVEFINGSASEIPLLQADICFSLGLLDWLSLDEIAKLRKNVKCDFYFHTFSEKRKFSLSQIAHKLYVFLKYGHKNVGYVPKYHSADEIKTCLHSDRSPAPRLLRRPELSFGCVAYHLPQEIEEPS